MSYKKIFLSGLVTKLENLFVFWEEFIKNQLKLMVSKKLLTNITSAQTLKVCFIYRVSPLLHHMYK